MNSDIMNSGDDKKGQSNLVYHQNVFPLYDSKILIDNVDMLLFSFLMFS